MTSDTPTVVAATTKLLRLLHSSLARAQAFEDRAAALEECHVALTNLKLIDDLDVHFADFIDAQAYKEATALDPEAELTRAEKKHGCKMAVVAIYSRHPKGPLVALAHLEADDSIPLEGGLRAAGGAVYQGLRKIAGLDDDDDKEILARP